MYYLAGVGSSALSQHRVVVSAHRGFVRAQLRRYGASSGSLDDLTQEVWLVALARSPEFIDERHTLAWLSQVCRRVAATERRARVRRPSNPVRVPEIPVSPAQGERLEAELDDLEGLAALAQLDDDMLDVLSLYGSGELTMREVADILHVPEPTAYSRYRTALDHSRRALRRAQAPGKRHTSIPAPSTASLAPNLVIDRELLADQGELNIHRGDSELVLGRIGNVVLSRWRQRFYPGNFRDIGALIDLAHERLGKVVLINDGDPDLRLPDASERALLRAHVSQHGRRVAIAVDIFNTPLTRFVAAIVQGAISITRARTSLVMVPSLEHARRWVEPYACTLSGPLPWDKLERAIKTLREHP
jgi:RNA polymerase sigma factor (sigma-70 family)